jgi:aspartate carbamoyltransferase catalytic subunit
MSFKHKHILGIEQMTKEDIQMILDTADSFKEINSREIKKVPTLRGKTIINAFFEASTRTRLSFEIAGKRLSADTVNMLISPDRRHRSLRVKHLKIPPKTLKPCLRTSSLSATVILVHRTTCLSG